MKCEYHPESIKLELKLWEAAFIKVLFGNIAPTKFTIQFVDSMYNKLDELLQNDSILFNEAYPNSFICEEATHTIYITNERIIIQEEE